MNVTVLRWKSSDGGHMLARNYLSKFFTIALLLEFKVFLYARVVRARAYAATWLWRHSGTRG